MDCGERKRTSDICGVADTFARVLLPSPLVRALAEAGFRKPSPVQEVAIPFARLGSDLVVQAKSGTGKTLVFAVACVEKVDPLVGDPQALVVAPTREVAVQIAGEVDRLAGGLSPPFVSVAVFIGGISVAEDRRRLRRRCHIAVGTPGRLQWLIENHELRTEKIDVCVLDEADQLFTPTLYKSVEQILHSLPKGKQLMAFSATYTPDVQSRIETHMRNPQRVIMVPPSKSAALLGVHHCYCLVGISEDSIDLFSSKVVSLLDVLSSLSFHQAVVFCNQQTDAQALERILTRAGFPAAFISGQKCQDERLHTMSAMRDFELRVIVSTDLVARGVDLDRVNLVCCLDLPQDSATYMHRIGRTGRFGTYGICIAFVNSQELVKLQEFMDESTGRSAEPLPDPVPEDWYSYQLQDPDEEMAYEKLLQAPVVPEPLRHFQDEPEHWVDPMKSAADGAPLDWWRDWMGTRDGIWDTWDPYEVDAKSLQESSACDFDSVVYSEECFPEGQVLWSRDVDGSVVEDPVDQTEETQAGHDIGVSNCAGSSSQSSCPSMHPGASTSPEPHNETKFKPPEIESLSPVPVGIDDPRVATASSVVAGNNDTRNNNATTSCAGAESGHCPARLECSANLWKTGLPVDCPQAHEHLQFSAAYDAWIQHNHWLQQWARWQAKQVDNINAWYTAYSDWHTQYSQWCEIYTAAQVLRNTNGIGFRNNAQSVGYSEEPKSE